MDIQLENKIKQIKNFKQCRNKTPEEIEKLAIEWLAKKQQKKAITLQTNEEIFTVEEFYDIAEHSLAIKKYLQYTEKCTITNEAQRGKLKSIVLLEVQLSAMLKQINKLRVEEEGVLPPPLLTAVRELLSQLDKLKDDVFGVKDDSAFNVLQVLFKKLRFWERENQLSREVTCPGCSKTFLLHMRTDKYETQKHPYLKDKLLCNDEMLNDYLQGILTREQYARYMQCNAKYVDWLLEHHFNKNNPLYQLYLERKNKEQEIAQKNG